MTVEKEGRIIGHLSKSKYDRFVKTIFYFKHANDGNACQVEV